MDEKGVKRLTSFAASFAFSSSLRCLASSTFSAAWLS